MMLFTCTHGPEEPERATVPFIAASVAAASGQQAVVVCTIEGVRLGVRGGVSGVQAPGLVPLDELYEGLVGAGGEVWLCSACTNARGITDEDVADGARIVGAAQIVAALAEDGNRSISLG